MRAFIWQRLTRGCRLPFMTDYATLMLDQLPNYRRWVKGLPNTRNGSRRCLLGAMNKVDENPGMAVQRAEYEKRLLRVIQEQYPNRRYCYRRLCQGEYGCGCGSDIRISRFNDDDLTRFADIRRVLEKTAADDARE